MTIPICESGGGCSSGWLPVTPRLRWLLAVHLALAVVPIAGFLIRPEVRFLPLLWAADSLPLGQLMSLSFWAGLGISKPAHRRFGTLFGVLYVGIWPIVAVVLSPHAQTPPIGTVIFDLGSKGIMFVSHILVFFVLTVIVIASLLVVRSCGYRLIRKATAHR